ncbi:MerR family transcriptional regulator [Streptomyces sp. SID3343]|uniref:MerR family transcriptional regulator n=1 Tax=Streptomyces sp. SID3343 TaxID=2690260 RepID=UPI001369203B|nr:MerR family transcriptional regulator [Streptomyces sp. SID3343]MYW01673.1 MerR family transcriptional regulator [Streptomyces sp. SID3343]
MHEELLTIGRFARLCRLSVKQLRHYDDVGLLTPTRVDAGTGYRYYAPEQARDALTIALLRDMDLPLVVIAEALAAEAPSRARILRAERDRLAERVARDQARLAMLDRLAQGGLPGYTVKFTTEPERRLAVVRSVCGPTELGATAGAGVGRLLAGLAAVGTEWAPPLWGLYPLDLDEGMHVAIGAQTREAMEMTEVVHASGLDVEVLRGGPVAETVHIGPYAELPLAYNALFAAVHERGLSPQAPVREAYLVAPGEAPDDEPTTRLLLPVHEVAAA